MNRRMIGQEKSQHSGETEEWQDWLVDKGLDQSVLSHQPEYNDKKELLNSAMKILMIGKGNYY